MPDQWLTSASYLVHATDNRYGMVVFNSMTLMFRSIEVHCLFQKLHATQACVGMLTSKQFLTFQKSKGSVKPKHEVGVLTIVMTLSYVVQIMEP